MKNTVITKKEGSKEISPNKTFAYEATADEELPETPHIH